MNSWKLNAQAGHHYRVALCKEFNIKHTELYRTVKDIDNKGVITTRDGRKFKVILKELKDE